MFNKNNKKIIFQEGSLAAKHLLNMPKPATNFVPEWFKKQKSYTTDTNNEIDLVRSEDAVATYKKCVPVVDSLTAGYNIELPATIYITNQGDKNNYAPFVSWLVEWTVCDFHKPDALANYPVPFEHHRSFFRWVMEWKIETPKGYSLWITHPSHRYDLPFTTINGFVDTDLHPNKLLLPFFIKNGFEGKVEAGTPIAQIIPIKRENWKSEKKDLGQDTDFIHRNNMKVLYSNVYKKNYWSKKRYM